MGPSVVAIVSTGASPCRCGEAWEKALRTLGLEPLPVAVEEMAAHRDALSGAALVIEYADTYRGSGELRPLVRHQLAAWGARLAGTPADAAQVADDKLAARGRLAAAGLAVAPGRLVADGDGWTFPAVVKRPFEHGSRGVALVKDRAELKAAARRWKADPSLFVEQYVEGREFALSVIEAEEGPWLLPPIEAVLPRGVLYSRKNKWGRRGPELRAAEVSPAEEERLRVAAIAAFRALGLRDLARFDVRLAADGPVFLEANVRPSVEPGTALPLAASLAGLPWPEAARLVLISAARRHGAADLLNLLRTTEL